MKKIRYILAGLCIVLLIVYLGFGKSVDYEVLANEEAPQAIHEAIESGSGNVKYSVFQDEAYTYIYYEAPSALAAGYITTELDVKLKGGKYFVIATVKDAANSVNVDRLIKLDKLQEKDIVFKEFIIN
ncbi:hypothetical protein GN156_00370 [bacterium LRH843]|nr:hypothetical protein [bacterium LRH843]